MQCCAGALERVFLPFGWHVCSAARVHLSGRAYRECDERVFLPFGWHGCSAARVHLSGRAYRECEVPYNSRVLRGSGRTCTKPVKNHMICAFLRPLQGGKNQKKRAFTGRPSHKETNKQTNKQTNERTNERTNEQTNERTNERTNKQTNKQPTNQPTNQPNQQTNKQKTNQTNNQTNKQTNQPTKTNQQTNKQTNNQTTKQQQPRRRRRQQQQEQVVSSRFAVSASPGEGGSCLLLGSLRIVEAKHFASKGGPRVAVKPGNGRDGQRSSDWSHGPQELRLLRTCVTDIRRCPGIRSRTAHRRSIFWHARHLQDFRVRFCQRPPQSKGPGVQRR